MKKETAIENLRMFFGGRGKKVFISCVNQLEDKIGFLSNCDNVVFDDYIDYQYLLDAWDYSVNIDIIAQNRKSIAPPSDDMCLWPWDELTVLLDVYENANGVDDDDID